MLKRLCLSFLVLFFASTVLHGPPKRDRGKEEGATAHAPKHRRGEGGRRLPLSRSDAGEAAPLEGAMAVDDLASDGPDLPEGSRTAGCESSSALPRASSLRSQRRVVQSGPSKRATAAPKSRRGSAHKRALEEDDDDEESDASDREPAASAPPPKKRKKGPKDPKTSPTHSASSKGSHSSLDELYGSGYAIATMDTAFKNMMSQESVVASFLSAFVPQLKGKLIEVKGFEPISYPVLKEPGQSQVFMDVHVKGPEGEHYTIEMQAKRHTNFDQRGLYYATAIYATQLGEKERKKDNWCQYLHPVIAIHVFDYDTNRAQGITTDAIPDDLPARVRAHPLPEGQFTKHFQLCDRYSGQVMPGIEVIQIELPRADRAKKLFPPQKTFTTEEWWLSLLRHARQYTPAMLKKTRPPKEIRDAFAQLDLGTWNPDLRRNYHKERDERKNFSLMFAAEHAEGEKKGEERGLAQGREEGREEEKLRITRALLVQGAPPQTIHAVTGLSLAEIAGLQS